MEAHYQALGGFFERENICPQCFTLPAAPPVAARLENREVSSSLLKSAHDWWQDHVDLLLVEGVGGWLCPLTKTSLVADFAQDCGWPVVIVAPRGLGALNHTLLTVEAVRSRHLPLAGIILNEHCAPSGSIAEQTNPAELARLTDVPILSLVEFDASKMLRQPGSQDTIDWEQIASQGE